jgi:hypothetical protein
VAQFLAEESKKRGSTDDISVIVYSISTQFVAAAVAACAQVHLEVTPTRPGGIRSASAEEASALVYSRRAGATNYSTPPHSQVCQKRTLSVAHCVFVYINIAGSHHLSCCHVSII